MKQLAGLLIVAAALLLVRRAGIATADGSSLAAMALGFTLLTAWIAGDLVRRLRLPRVTGYLLFGIAIGPFLGNVVTQAMAGQLRVVTAVATTLIAFMAGLMLNASRLRDRLRAVSRITALSLGLTFVGLATAAWMLWPWLPIGGSDTAIERLVMVGLLAIVASSFSPTVAAAVATETGARGRLSELVLAVSVLADLTLLIAFSLALPLARIAFGGNVVGAELLVRLAWEVGGAIAFGVFAGAAFALYLRYVGREITLATFALCAALAQVGTSQDLEPLLAALAAGVTIENLAVAQGDTLRAAIQRGAPPVLLIFFVAVGASLRLDALASAGALAVGLVLLRIGLLYAAAHLWASRAHASAPSDRWVWTGLVSQAGITLGLTATLAVEFEGWGGRIQMLAVAMLALNELAGPLLYRLGLSRAGEVDHPEPSPLIVVSNREPYLHHRTAAGEITATAATGGVAVALDALMRQRGGVWIAHGAGDADRLVVDDADKISVPPAQPAYDLRRLWIDDATFAAYYGGFANEGLWPLCHQVDVRPTFNASDWDCYRQVNEQFAAAIDEEMGAPDARVFIQDYHLALVASALRRRRPEARTALFWHIPWPHADRLRICPWQHELLEGLLANDLLAFQLERDRTNFLEVAARELGADIEEETSRVLLGGRRTTVVTVPIGVDFDRIQAHAASTDLRAEQRRLRTQFRLDNVIVGVGVDRLDYTKGIAERVAALDALVTARPDLRGRLTFVQIGVPSRSELRDYAAVEHALAEQVDAVNRRHHVPGRPPLIAYSRTPLTLPSLVALYRLAHFCVVSSLHDGMNLVAKEFVAARQDEDGVLVLSALAGAAQELTDAIIINPYDAAGFADALRTAIEMPAAERRARMRAMRQVVAGRDVFAWASDILDGLEHIWTQPLHDRVQHWEEMAV